MLEPAWEELNGNVDLLLDFRRHLTHLGEGVDTQCVQLFSDEWSNSLYDLQVISIRGFRNAKNVEVNTFSLLSNALKFFSLLNCFFIEEKLNALGITTYRQLANMNAKLETEVNEAIEFFPGRVKRDQWVAQAKILLGEDVKLDEKAIQQAEELERIAQKAEGIDFDILGVAKSSDRDDLQVIKGIGPFIAEKLYALGIYTFSQVSKMTPEIEEQVNVAIEFFPGRVKRDEWAKQAKELAKD